MTSHGTSAVLSGRASVGPLWKNGIDAWIDQYVQDPKEGLPK
ncbi:MAG TPA: hypothetical protein VGD78_07795 [Chthoniobacterales bacterium]